MLNQPISFWSLEVNTNEEHHRDGARRKEREELTPTDLFYSKIKTQKMHPVFYSREAVLLIGLISCGLGHKESTSHILIGGNSLNQGTVDHDRSIYKRGMWIKVHWLKEKYQNKNSDIFPFLF
jgi:hypothetical protein